MDFGGGFAVGIAAGIGSGIATGVATGRKQAKQEMRNYIEQNNITLHDRYGQPIKTDDFVDAVCVDHAAACTSNKKWLFLALMLGLAVAGGIFAYFLMR